jgi:hypothetical protein
MSVKSWLHKSTRCSGGCRSSFRRSSRTIQETLEKAVDFFERYDKIGAILRYDEPGLGMNESEFNARLTETVSWLVRNRAPGNLMGYWNQLMSSVHDDSSPWP